jgi:leucyl-tRNA synthetase/predicted alpha/beta hydrolase family esterase
MSLYDHRKLESKWRAIWEDELKAGTSNWLFDEEKGKKGQKAYLLDMFPYPSGSGLHVGHVEEKAAIDILARYLRMRGQNVLMPTGYDSFGLPTENYAIKNELTPEVATKQNTQNFHEQTTKLGISYDWTRELATSDPDYYKFTQWWFKFLYERGLAYRKKQSVNWCPVDQTVLANEQVIDGKCERCDNEVVQKDLEQWFFKITDYAERLLADLEKLDWPESTKAGQRNWIGKSEGALVDFLVPKYEKILVATNNPKKVERLRNIIADYGLGIELLTPKEAGLSVEVEEGDDVSANAKKKAEAYRAQTNLPVIGMDSGFAIAAYPELTAARVRRNALGELDEKSLSQAEVAKLMQEYYQSLVRESGKQQLSAQWFDALALSLPNGQTQLATGVRNVQLMAEMSTGPVDVNVPLNSVVMSEKLGKYASELSPSEELLYIEATVKAVLDLCCERITVFTTRLDTIYGANYVVLAPEHQLTKKLASPEQAKAVEAYIVQAGSKTEMQRTALAKDKTGVATGNFAVNPVTKQKVPVWVADYVLNTYGTGAVMGVPAHDDRDFSFAIKYGLPLTSVVLRPEGNRYICYATADFINDFSDFSEGLAKFGNPKGSKFKLTYLQKMPEKLLFTIDQEQLDDFCQFAVNFIKENAWLDLVGDKHVALFAGGERIETPKYEHNSQLLAKLKGIEPSIAKHDHLWGMLYDSPYADYVCYGGEGVLINSAEASGLRTEDARREFAELLATRGIGKQQINYKLRDWSISRQRFWGSPIPVVYKELDKSEQEKQRSFEQGPELVLDIHALASGPEQAYHRWLRTELGTQGVTAVAPQLSGAENPKLATWMLELQTTLAELVAKAKDPRNLVLTGRSLGAWAALKLAETTPVRKLVLVAPLTPAAFGQRNPEGMTDELAAKLSEILGTAKLNWENIRQNVSELVIYLGSDDPYIPLTDTETWFRENYGQVRVVSFRGAGHFKAESGFTEFPQLLAEILAPVRLDIMTVASEELPVRLPDDVDYRPKGTAPLGTSVKFNEGLVAKFGKGSYREIDTMDTFVCSSWYFFRFLDPNNDKEFASQKKLNKFGPVDFYIGGAEHTVLHLLYSRFFTKVAYDAGLIDYDEPFLKLRHQGLILGPDNRKMSKRWGNVINPTDIVESYGADTLRMYEMFMGPLDQMKAWSEGGVKGIRRFLQRIWDSHQELQGQTEKKAESQKVLGTLNKLITKVGNDIENLKFNTAVSEFMKFINLLQEENYGISLENWGKFLQTLFPFAPFLSSELWESAGLEGRVDALWPEPVTGVSDADSAVKITISINGKMRDIIEVHKSTQEAEVLEIALQSPKVARYVSDKAQIKKVIFVPNKILNLVV